jgi:hypothetical protein
MPHGHEINASTDEPEKSVDFQTVMERIRNPPNGTIAIIRLFEKVNVRDFSNINGKRPTNPRQV